MHLKISFLLIAFITVFKLFAQEKLQLQQYAVNLGINGLSVEGEFKISRQSTILPGIGYGVFTINTINEQVYKGSDVRSGDVAIPAPGVSPFASLEWRNYYNLEKRHRQNKNVDHNSGNFWGIRATSYFLKPLVTGMGEIKANYRAGAIYGLQRAGGRNKNILFNVNGGIAVWANHDFSFISGGPTLQAKIGLLIR